MADIKSLNFNAGVSANLRRIKYGTNWPVVYLIHNDNELYIGETTDVSIRAGQHLSNDDRKRLENITVISDETFNKSAISDLEAFLIKYMSADNKFKLQNGNSGLKNHNYYQREMYEKKFKEIWLQLKSKGLVNSDLRIIENSDLFKYSPYKSLTDDQYMIVTDILSLLAEEVKKDEPSTFLIQGSYGTGKTVLAIYLMKLLADVGAGKTIVEDEEVEQYILEILEIKKAKSDFKFAFVVPMDNLRVTIKKVFKEIAGLNPNMVLSPNEVAKSEEYYDLLIVDEAHRLRRRKNLAHYKTFDDNNKNLNLSLEGTELDWILLKSKYQILFYHDIQSIKPSDVPKSDFDKLMLRKNYHPYYLETQLRCMRGGNEYIDYISSIFSNNPPKKKIEFEEYDLKLFDNVNDMVENIKAKDKEYGLCRNVAGYAWLWKSKGKKLPMHLTKKDITKIIKSNLYDIEIDGYKYIWNTKVTDWINSSNSINEIGSIHTTQGIDLNYVGLIIGNDLKYDVENQKIFADRKNYYDAKGKDKTSDEELLTNLLNTYRIMCTRGILGTYIYVCDENLRNYFKKYINKSRDNI